MKVLVAIFLMALAGRAEARFAEAGDLGSVHEAETAEIEVDRRGHSKLVVERIIRINNDEGRDKEGVQVVDFNARAMRFKVLAAHTVNGGKLVSVKPSAIEIRAVGDFSNSFDVQKRAKLTYPDLKPGSKVYLKYQIDTDEVPEEGFFSFFADFNGWYIERYRLTIRSRLPLHFWKNDPQGLLDLAVSEGGHVLEARTKGPVRLLPIREQDAFVRPERSLALVVSSLDRWDGYARATVARYESLLRSPLPAPLERIKKEAAAESLPVDKLDRATSGIARDFRYFADWRRRRGGFVPRSLQEVAESRYGDCKDLSLVAVAILRALGFKAEVAWVMRGEPQMAPPRDWYQLPFDGFNHAVVRAEDAEKRVYWIDVTEPVSHARAVPSEIAGRPAFALRNERPGIEFIPEFAVDDYLIEKILKLEKTDERSLSVEGTMAFKGRAAEAVTEDALYKTKENFEYDLIHEISSGYQVVESQVGEFARGSRIVKDLSISFEFTAANAGLRTNGGGGLMLPREAALERLVAAGIKDRASDVFIDSPGRWISRIQLTGMRRQGKLSLDCDLQSEWLKASRKVSDSGEGVEVVDRIEVLKSVVPNERLRSLEFREFQKKLVDCFDRVALIVEAR